MKIINPTVGVRLELKRFVPPFTITDECPKCGETCEGCGILQCLSYPVVGVPTPVTFYCYNCGGGQWSRGIIITITAKAAPRKRAAKKSTKPKPSKKD